MCKKCNNAGSVPGFKRPERTTYHQLPSRSKVKNAWKFTVVSPELRVLVLGQIGKCLPLFFSSINRNLRFYLIFESRKLSILTHFKITSRMVLYIQQQFWASFVIKLNGKQTLVSLVLPSPLVCYSKGICV
jgi:hypothetical protein